MKIIKKENLRYDIKTGRNFGERAAKNWLKNNLPKKKIMRSLFAQGYSIVAINEILKGISKAAESEYGLLAFKGYVSVSL